MFSSALRRRARAIKTRRIRTAGTEPASHNPSSCDVGRVTSAPVKALPPTPVIQRLPSARQGKPCANQLRRREFRRVPSACRNCAALAILASLGPRAPARCTPDPLPERSLINRRTPGTGANTPRALTGRQLPPAWQRWRTPGQLICSLESDRERNLKCVPLERRPAREFLKILGAHGDLPRRKDRVCRKTKS